MARNPADIEQLIARINASERLRANSRYSAEVYRDEPIVRTGRQLMKEREAAGRPKQVNASAKRSGQPAATAGAPRQASASATRGKDFREARQERIPLGAMGGRAASAGHAAVPGGTGPKVLAPQAPSRAFQLGPQAHRYQEMRGISRWQESGGRGRWLTEAELFVRQARLMADMKDDHPYHGTFKSYFPTYNAMSDQQLRGYFTWRAAVRRGDIQETSLSFAYVYLYELINGIGVADPQEGFSRLHGFWQAYRTFSPEIDRFVRVWLRDYVVFYGLDPKLLADDKTLGFDRALIELRELSCLLDSPDSPAAAMPVTPGGPAASPAGASLRKGASKKTRRGPALPLPVDEALETRLLESIDALSTYRIRLSRLYKDHPDDLRHVACAVYVRMLEYYRRNRKSGMLESLFGKEATMPYTMFASAVFCPESPHPDALVELDPIHSYRCERGLWTCTRVFGTREKNARLGSIMRACDRMLRDAMGYPYALKARPEPKYLERIIDREATEWLAWKSAHAPRVIDIDLSKLSGIRSAAAETREALLIDEEREGDAPASAPMPAAAAPSSTSAGVPGRALATDVGGGKGAAAVGPHDEPPAVAPRAGDASSPEKALAPDAPVADAPKPPEAGSPLGAPAAGAPVPPADGDASPLTGEQAAYLAALLEGAPAPVPAGTSEDMLVDAINEALYDALGDTAIEFGADGPRIIEDYEDDVRGLIAP